MNYINCISLLLFTYSLSTHSYTLELFVDNYELNGNYCLEKACRSLLVEHNDHYEFNAVKQLSLPYNNIFFASHASSSVNQCGLLYFYNKNNQRFQYIRNNDNQAQEFCSISQFDSYIKSWSRVSASQYAESLWEINNNVAINKYTDTLVGDNFIERSKDGETYLVTKDETITKRSSVTGVINIDKAYFHTHNGEKKKAYVIKGDKVNLIRYSKCNNYILSRYNKTEGYIKKEHIKFIRK